MIPKARDVMQTGIVAVGPSTPLLDVHRLFTEEEISGAPVVDDDGTLLGVITSTDLIRAVEEEHDSGRVAQDYFRDLLPYSSPDWASGPEDFQDRLREIRAEDVMTVEVLTVAPETPVRLGSEHDSHEWLSPAEAGARFAWPRERRALEDAVQLLGSGDGGAVEDVLRIC